MRFTLSHVLALASLLALSMLVAACEKDEVLLSVDVQTGLVHPW